MVACVYVRRRTARIHCKAVNCNIDVCIVLGNHDVTDSTFRVEDHESELKCR